MTLPRKVCYLALSTLVFLSLSFIFISHSASRAGFLRVTFLNVGQGDAIFIETPNGAQFVVDGGPGNTILSELPHVMPFFDRTIDGIMITNPDTDHYAGFLETLSRYNVGIVVESGTISKTSTYASLEKMITEQKIPKTIAKRGQKIVLDAESGVYIEILFPDRDVSNLSTNDGSIIAKLVYKNTSMMLQGDAPEKIETYLLSLGDDLNADILKTGHHGSKTSSAFEYVKAVSPQYAVISSGGKNRYGHPHQEVLETLKDLNVSVLRTDTEGRVTFISDGQSFVRGK
ncbi:MAG: MBL fold metallo-hydrolase [Candidatus Paceibacterota bacterium]|jgi:competence protein ComEC